jgi:tRNA-2-methylthio-N6-dimethylallyladenosine synthase
MTEKRNAGKPLDLTSISLPSDSITSGELPVKRQNRQRALITIMTGCNNFCTYCIVPYTRGREKSRIAADVVREVKQAVSEGARDVMLLGQNVNSYGVEERKRGEDPALYPTFSELLSEIALIDRLFVLRYMTSHPCDLSDELINVIGRIPVIEPHIHLPLQSGSDHILKKMNRRYDAAHYLSLVKKLRETRPDITISTDLIVGFPGETEDDFRATLRVMEEARFDAAFTFIYSPREGTPAARWFDSVSSNREEDNNTNHEATIRDRFERLTALQNRLSYDSNVKLEGREVAVLVDGSSKRSPDIFSGRTRDHRLVNFTAPDRMSLSGNNLLQAGDIVLVRIDHAKIYSLEGTVTSILERSLQTRCP